jgi:gliding motility-associated-like protein
LANVFSDTTICASSSLNIISSPSGGYMPYTYLWSTGDTTSSIIVTPSVNTTYSIVVTDFCNNDSTFNIEVGVSNPDYVIIGDSICEGDTAVLSVNPLIPYDYLWNTGAQTQSISVSPNMSTQYIVTVTDSAGCEVIKNTTVKVYTIPIVNSTSDTIICRGDEAFLKVYGDYSVVWNTGATSSYIKVSPNSDKVYSFFISNMFHCYNNDSIKVEVISVPIADIYVPNDTICLGRTIVLQGSGGDEYKWSSGVSASNMEVLLTKNTSFTLTVTNVNGATSCSHDTSISIYVERCNYFYFASAFTPNGDGINDTYGVGGQFEAVNQFDLYIYNRWGKQVFHATDPNERWDGTFEGEDAPDGVYTYVVYIDELYRDPYSLNGTITLYR